MRFISRLAGVAKPRSDVFSYIFEARRCYPRDRILYIEDETKETLTVEELEKRSRQMAFHLTVDCGIKRGDVVGILATDTILFPISYLGVLVAGGIVQLIPIQKELAAADVVARLKAANTKVLITDDYMHGIATLTVAEVGVRTLINISQSLHIFDCDYPQFYAFNIATTSEAEAVEGFLNRTSGSTGGAMKTVITTHAHFIAVLDATLRTVPQNTNPDEDVWLSTLSLGFFINAKLNIGLNILLGIPVVLTQAPLSPRNVELVERYKATFLFLPPPVAISFAGTPNEGVDVSSIKWLLSAGATMNEGVQKAVSKNFNNVHLDMEWGTAETLLISIQTEGHNAPLGSSGCLVNGIEAMVIDTATGGLLGPGDVGEILVRNSAARYAGYRDNLVANTATFDRDGWFHSGDFGCIDENNNVFIKDRIKELIRVGSGYGVHVSATEMEAVIFAHPAVSEVIVTGVPNAITQQDLPTAFVVLESEWQSRQVEALECLSQLTAEKLVGLQSLTGGFLFVSQFPLIGFKINRRALRTMALQQPSKTGNICGPQVTRIHTSWPDKHGKIQNMHPWSATSWRQKLVAQPIVYEDQSRMANMLVELAKLPDLVPRHEIENLCTAFESAATGKAFIIQGGDCAEAFADVVPSIIHMKQELLLSQAQTLQNIFGVDIIPIGRIAGQYAKPRSNCMETLSCGSLVNAFRGDNINGLCDSDRKPDPERLQIGYYMAAVTLSHLRKNYKQTHPQNGPRTSIFTSHEALHLPLESSMTKEGYNTSAHMLWIGERTRSLDGAHVEYLRGLRNPIGVKIGPGSNPEELVHLLDLLNPNKIVGKVALITRLGYQNVGLVLPSLLRAVAKSGHVPVWLTDPCHGNTVSGPSKRKTRIVEQMFSELKVTYDIHKESGSILGGIHLEQTGEDDVTECVDWLDQDLETTDFSRFRSLCDPRLSRRQAQMLVENFAEHVYSSTGSGVPFRFPTQVLPKRTVGVHMKEMAGNRRKSVISVVEINA